MRIITNADALHKVDRTAVRGSHGYRFQLEEAFASGHKFPFEGSLHLAGKDGFVHWTNPPAAPAGIEIMKDQLMAFPSFKVINAEPLPESTIRISNGVIRSHKKPRIFKSIKNALKFSIYCHFELPKSAKF